MSHPNPSRWQLQKEKTFADCRIFSVHQETWKHPGDDRQGEFYVMHCPGWVNVLALTADRQLVMVRQFRYGTRDLSLEIPGGLMEEGESPVETGERELREETGYVGASARVLASVHPNPAIQSNRCHLVLVEGVEKKAAIEWDGNEEMEVLTMPVDEVLEKAWNGEITHSLVIDALFYLQRFLAQGGKGSPLKGGG